MLLTPDMKAPAVTQQWNKWNEKEFQPVQDLCDDWRFQDNPAPKEPPLISEPTQRRPADTDKEEERRWKMDSGRLAPKPRGASRGVSLGPGPSRPPPPALYLTVLLGAIGASNKHNAGKLCDVAGHTCHISHPETSCEVCFQIIGANKLFIDSWYIHWLVCEALGVGFKEPRLVMWDDLVIDKLQHKVIESLSMNMTVYGFFGQVFVVIPLFRSITLLCGTDGILQCIPHIQSEYGKSFAECCHSHGTMLWI
jgi:hypothetical protein